ncbi:Brain tumor protein [Nymphon striatum]|nr:Brain tumor protein [Nymphon striatum]
MELETERESPVNSTTSFDESPHLCKICSEDLKQPRVLSCLHVFCEECLEERLNKKDNEDKKDKKGDSFDTDDSDCKSNSSPSITENGIVCPKCSQETEVANKAVSNLLPDYVMCNQLDLNAIQNPQIICTSCKAKEKAVARCSDCSSFLCPNCVNAHHFMRCFENHKVVTFEEMKKSGDEMILHKPITCPQHNGELIKYFCQTCQETVCHECLRTEHCLPKHQHECIVDNEDKHKKEIEKLIEKGKIKMKFCEDTESQLSTTLSNMHEQKKKAELEIDAAIEKFTALINAYGKELHNEVNEIYSNNENSIMKTLEAVMSTYEKIEDACKFAENLVANGNGVEILSLKKLVQSQLLNLIDNIPYLDKDFSIVFQSDYERGEHVMKEVVGSFKKEERNAVNKDSSTHSPLEPDTFSLSPDVLNPRNMPSTNGNIDLELSDLTGSAIAEYNLHQLAGLVHAQEQHRMSSPHGSGHNSSQPSPASAAVHAAAMTLRDIIPSSGVATPTDASAHLNTINNLTVLAKLGSLSLANNGQTLLNGQLVSSLSRDSTASPTASNRNSGPTPPLIGAHSSSSLHGMPQSPIESSNVNCLNALLNGSVSRSMSPHPDGSLINGGGMTSALSGQPNGPPPRNNSSKLSSMQIRCKFGQMGPGKSQFNSPHGFCLGVDEDVIVADTNNHRIQIFDKIGEFKSQFGVPGKEEGQLWYPRKVAVMRNSGKYVVCDRGNERSRMQIFSKTGHFIKKIAIRYIDIVAGLAITDEGHIVAVDSVSPTVFIIGESGDLLRWFDCSDYMREPSDIAISQKEFYVCDFKGHCVVVFNNEGTFSRRIGCENVTNFPNGIDISDAGDVLVGDSHGNRFHVAVFQRDGSLLSEFECPYVKVSRCCGLKITSEGYVVTLAKNNHHVLILNTLYIS